MLKLLTYAAPFLLKGPTKGPVKKLIGRSVVYALMFFGLLCGLAALFVWVYKTYSLEAAFLAVGAIFFTGALIVNIAIWMKRPKPHITTLPEKLDGDFIASHLPASLVKDPVVQRILKEIAEKPVAATAVAVTLGMLVSRELFDRD